MAVLDHYHINLEGSLVLLREGDSFIRRMVEDCDECRRFYQSVVAVENKRPVHVSARPGQVEVLCGTGVRKVYEGRHVWFTHTA